MRGLKSFVTKYHPKIYLTKTTFKHLNFLTQNQVKIIKANQLIKYQQLSIHTFATSHDNAEGIGFVFSNDEQKFVHVTDTGYLSTTVLEMMQNAQMYLIESNYDYQKLIKNERYPFLTKQRILSDSGHLSNDQCYQYLKQLINPNTKKILFAHVSENNNTKQLVEECFNDVDVIDKIVLAKDEIVEVELG